LEYEHLYTQLKAGKTLAERLSAADSLRLALADYPLNGVGSSQISKGGADLFCRRSPISGMRLRIL
jgi:hypothetical protein